MTANVSAGIPSSEVPGRAPLRGRPFPIWPVYGLILPAFVAIWSGWVGLGQMTGFGPVTLFPGISGVQLNTAITLPIGMETYAAFALGAWLSGRVPAQAQRFAKRSVWCSLAIGAVGQIIYHLMAAAGWHSAPWPVTMAVACIPVAVLGMGATLAHLIRQGEPEEWNVDQLVTGTLPEAPISPAPASGRQWTSAELVRAADAIEAEQAELTKAEVAALLGVSDRRIRQARKAMA